MKQTAMTLVLAGSALAGCQYLPASAPAPVDPGRAAAFVSLVERSDCRFDPLNHQPLHDAGFTDPEMADIGVSLIAGGQARRLSDGGLLMATEACL